MRQQVRSKCAPSALPASLVLCFLHFSDSGVGSRVESGVGSGVGSEIEGRRKATLRRKVRKKIPKRSSLSSLDMTALAV